MAKLIYRAGFKNRVLTPLYDPEQLGPLQLTQAEPLPGTAADKMEIPLAVPPTPWKARFTVERTAPPDDDGPPGEKRDDCYVGAVVHPFPVDRRGCLFPFKTRGTPLFKIRATFEMPDWVSDDRLDYAWAMAIFARKGDVAYWPTRDERTTVTLQSARKSGALSAQMNAVGGTRLDDPSKGGAGDPIPNRVYEGIFDSQDPPRMFTLELLIDRNREMARESLEVYIDSVPYRESHWFIHPLIHGESTKGPIESVGFAIAIARGKGTASATISDFSIYRLSFLDLLIDRLGVPWFGAFSSRPRSWQLR